MLHSRWSILALLFLARLTIALQFQSVGSLSGSLIGAFAIDFAQLGLLIGLYMLPGVFVAIPGGVLGQRFGAKRVVVCGLALMAAGGAFAALADGFVVLLAGRLAGGIGAVLLNILLTKMLADWFAGREIATATSLLIASWPLGIALALAGCGSLEAAAGWRFVMLLIAIATAAAALAIALGYRDPPALPSGGASGSPRLTRREWVLVACASVVWGAFNVAFVAIVTFAPDLLALRGMETRDAAWIVSLVGWLLIPAAPLCGYLADRFAAPVALMATGFAVVAVALCVLALTDATWLPVVIVALFIGLPPGLIVAMPARVLRPAVRAIGMGGFYTGYYAMMALLPGVAGSLRDLAGAAAPMLFAAALMALAGLGLGAFHMVARRA